MALKSSINGASPDKTEIKYDRDVSYRGYWNADEDTGVFSFVKLGHFVRTAAHTVKTWYACTQAACTTFIGSYSGDGSYVAEEVSEVLHAFNFVLTETEFTEEWVDYVEPE